MTVVDDFITRKTSPVSGRWFCYEIDAIDSVRPKAALIAYCRRHKVPLVTNRRRGRINRSDINRSPIWRKPSEDPLAACCERLKSQFGVVKKQPKVKLGVDCVFSTGSAGLSWKDGVCTMKSNPTAEGQSEWIAHPGLAATMVTATFILSPSPMRWKKMLAKGGAADGVNSRVAARGALPVYKTIPGCSAAHRRRQKRHEPSLIAVGHLPLRHQKCQTEVHLQLTGVRCPS